ncbi:queuine tRNA-ribosyltransferase accessory subunit 2-like [Diadema setosum]|uniref:queuine tRNA-ribosyltransferase accessory subunit 2-like n=1 Tax=Diadema setosum TaxID=31175 RepID=UPI003B3ADAAC
MKFQISAITKEGCRRGVIRELGCHGNLYINTPACLLYMRAGAVPHLTGDLVESLQEKPQSVHLTISTLVDQHDTLFQFGKGIAQFAGLQSGVTFVGVQDPAHPCPTGYNDKQSVSVFTPAGRTKLDVDLFMSLQEAIQPDWFEALCDGDTPLGCSMKRTKKSVDRTLDFLDQCLEVKQKSEILKKADILGVIEGGQVLSERVRSAKETALRPVAGFVLDAFSDLQVETNSRWELLALVMKELPQEKPRMLTSVGRPDNVLRAIEEGVDLFDSAYTYEVTERGCALVFPVKTREVADEKASPAAYHSQNTPQIDSCGGGKTDPRFELDLSEKRFIEDNNPIVTGCDCYSCSHHTRGYINHLLNVNELLAKVLLMNHNCHHYYQFFRSIQTSLEEDTFQQLKNTVTGER